MLRNAFSISGFHRSRVADPSVVCASFEAFQALCPLTTKADLVANQAAFPPYGNNRTEPDCRYLRFCQTSGTTARPLAVWDTLESWDWLLENWVRGFAMAGVRSGTAAFFAFSFGPFLGFWTAFEAGLRFGLRCLPGGGLGTAARLSALIEHRVEVLCCTPTYALHLAAAARAAGIDPAASGVRTILVAGEPGGSLPSVTAQLSEAWPRAEVIDHYGMTEVGPVAFAVSGRPGAMRILEERYVAEVLHPVTGRSVGEGEMGELVLTPLGRSAWPIFRYRTGDLVRTRRDADGLWLEGGILGRVDDMVIIRGVNLFPSAVDAVVRQFPEVLEYRATVRGGRGLSEVSLEVESSAQGDGLAPRLEAAFERAFSLRIPVREVAAGTLPRFEMKAKRWVRADG